jgi:transposase-like protein
VKSGRSLYYGHRFPPEVISYAVWVYHRFCLSFRDVEDLLAERGIIVSYERIRIWCQKFGPGYARNLKGRQGRLGDTWHLDELFILINGQQHYLWRAVDQDGDVIDILVQPRRDQRPAERFFRRLLRRQGKEPFRIVTGKLRSYSAALVDESHPSLIKALGMLGLGRSRVVRVPVDGQGRMLATEMPALKRPAIVCMQAGNVNTGAFDPAPEICARAHSAGAWIHVDGAFGLWAAASEKYAHLAQGIADADSWANGCAQVAPTVNLPD